MNRTIIAALAIAIAYTGLAGAQEATPSPTPTPVETPAPAAATAPAKFYLELDQADLNAVSAALNELPKKIADPLILKLNGQLQAQQKVVDARDKALKEPEPKKGKK